MLSFLILLQKTQKQKLQELFLSWNGLLPKKELVGITLSGVVSWVLHWCVYMFIAHKQTGTESLPYPAHKSLARFQSF